MQAPLAQHRKEMAEEERRQYAEVFKVEHLEKEKETAPKTTDRRSNLVIEESRESQPLIAKPKEEEGICSSCVIV